MIITKQLLEQIIKEELEEGGFAGHYEKKRLERGPTFDIQDAIQMLLAERHRDTTGTLHLVISRLYAALDKLEGGGYDPGHYGDNY